MIRFMSSPSRLATTQRRRVFIETASTTTTTATTNTAAVSITGRRRLATAAKIANNNNAAYQDVDAQRRAYQYYYQQQQRPRNNNNNNPLRRWWNTLWKSSSSKTTNFTNSSSSTSTLRDRNQKVATYAAAAVMGALGATYASVPLYKLFCQATGFGGTTQRVQDSNITTTAAQSQQPLLLQYMQSALHQWTKWQRRVGGGGMSPSSGTRVHSWTDPDAAQRLATLQPVPDAQLITVRLDSTVGDVLPWTFEPTQQNLRVVPGETALTFFRVTNHADHPIVGVATYNVHPPKMGLYFHKIQCFCFEEQRLLGKETVDMPVFFFIDPDILQDGQLATITDMTLSYTFFPSDMEYDDSDDDDDDDGEAVENKKASA